MKKKLAALAATRPWLATLLGTQERFGELNGTQLAASLAFVGFLSIFPLLFVGLTILGFVASGNDDIATSIVERLGLGADSLDSIQAAVDAAQRNRGLSTAISFVTLSLSALGLSSALAHVQQVVWQTKVKGWRVKVAGVVWMAGAGLILLASLTIPTLLTHLPGWLAPLGLLVGVATNAAVFLWSKALLPTRSIPTRALWPGAIVFGIGAEILKIVGTVYVPRAIANSSALYGSIGAILATLAWLALFARVYVLASTLTVVSWERTAGTTRFVIDTPALGDRPAAAVSRAGLVLPAAPVTAAASGPVKGRGGTK